VSRQPQADAAMEAGRVRIVTEGASLDRAQGTYRQAAPAP
jgi:hypothetical protein